ncbi:MAG: flippase [Pseudomonadota bacterium]
MNKLTDPFWLRFLPAALRSRVSGRPGLHAILHNSGWLVLEKCVRLVLGLLVGAWMARYLGPIQYGELAYALVFIAFFQVVASLGLDGIVVRELALSQEKAGGILGTAFQLRLMTGIVCWAVAVAGMGLLNGWQHSSTWITALAGASLVFQATDTIDLWFQSQSQSRRTVIAKLGAYIISNGIKIILIKAEAPLLAFAFVIALDIVLAAGGLIIAYKYFPCDGPWHRVSALGQKLLKESWPFIVSGLSIMVYMRIDQIMIRELLGQRELGIYAAVLPFASLWQFIPMTLSVSIAPFLIRKRQESETEYMRALAGIFRIFSALGWMVCLFILAMSSFIVDVLLGQEYREGSKILSIYVFTNLFIGLGVAQGLWLLNEGKSLISLFNALLGAIACLIGNFLLIPSLGLKGAAITAVLAQMVAAMLSNLILSPKMFALQVRGLILLGYKG